MNVPESVANEGDIARWSEPVTGERIDAKDADYSEVLEECRSMGLPTSITLETFKARLDQLNLQAFRCSQCKELDLTNCGTENRYIQNGLCDNCLESIADESEGNEVLPWVPLPRTVTLILLLEALEYLKSLHEVSPTTTADEFEQYCAQYRRNLITCAQCQKYELVDKGGLQEAKQAAKDAGLKYGTKICSCCREGIAPEDAAEYRRSRQKEKDIARNISAFEDYCNEQHDNWRLYHDNATLDAAWADKYSIAGLDDWKNQQIKAQSSNVVKRSDTEAWTLKGDYFADALPPLNGEEAVSGLLREFLRAHLGLVIAERWREEMMFLRSFALGYRGMDDNKLRCHMNRWLKSNSVLSEWIQEEEVTVEDLISAANAEGKKRKAA